MSGHTPSLTVLVNHSKTVVSSVVKGLTTGESETHQQKILLPLCCQKAPVPSFSPKGHSKKTLAEIATMKAEASQNGFNILEKHPIQEVDHEDSLASSPSRAIIRQIP